MMKGLLVCLALLVGGCAANLQEPGAQLATQYAVMRWIDQGEGDPVVRAHRVLAIAEALERDPAMVPVDGLRAAVVERVAGFDPADQVLAVGLVDLLVPYIDTREPMPVALSDLALLLRRAAWYYTH